MKLTFLIIFLFSFECIADQGLKTKELTDGKNTKGFMLKNISTESFYEKLGLKSSDRIIKINGNEVTELSEVMDGLANVKTITIFRSGKEIVLNYNTQK